MEEKTVGEACQTTDRRHCLLSSCVQDEDAIDNKYVVITTMYGVRQDCIRLGGIVYNVMSLAGKQ